MCSRTQAWLKSNAGVRCLLGCGCVWLPSSEIDRHIDVTLWQPGFRVLEVIPGMDFRSTFYADVVCICNFRSLNDPDLLAPGLPDLKTLREVIIMEYLRPQHEVTLILHSQSNEIWVIYI